MHRMTLYIAIILLVLSTLSCKKKFEPAEEAFFITAKDIRIATGAGQGYGSHKITELWLYTNGNFRGAYPVGSRMPVMVENGKAVIDVFAGIMNNGISETRMNWLLYEPLKIDTMAANGTNIERNFTFKYRNSVKFVWVENFELPGFSLVRSSISDTTYKIHTNNGNVFEGNKSIEFGLSGNALTAQLETATTYSLPMGGSSGNLYLELDYKCNSSFVVGVISNGAFTEVLTVNAKDNWNHIYVQLSNAVNADPSTSYKKIAFRVKRDNSAQTQSVFLDNIKLVYL